MNYHFANAIRSGKPPYPDVYRGVAMSIIGPLAYRSHGRSGEARDTPASSAQDRDVPSSSRRTRSTTQWQRVQELKALGGGWPFRRRYPLADM